MGSRPRLTLRQRLRRDRVMLALVLPGLAFFLVFYYLPLLGYIVAFENYQAFLGFIQSQFVGFANFTTLFADPMFWQAVVKTLEIAGLELVLFFPAPIGLALLLNSVVSARLRKFVQSVVYLPHFIGWVVLVSVFEQVLGPTGSATHLLSDIGISFQPMTTGWFFPFLMALEVVWKDTGWGTIIFLAALLSIDTQLYEASAVDGAGRWRRLWHITLPGIRPVIILLFILNLGSILSVGFEQILLQYPNVGLASGQVLDVYVYLQGIVDGNWGTAAAAGLIKGVVGLVLILGANKIAHWFGQEGVYQRAR
jgi:putative aldouronate transport system permease protein